MTQNYKFAVLLGLLACVEDPSAQQFRSFATASDAEADGVNVAIQMLSNEGDMICKKAMDGASFSSTGADPRVLLYIDGILRDTVPYEAGDTYIGFGVHATDPELNLAPGSHTAYCAAVPDMGFAVDGMQWVMCDTGWSDEVCTKSGLLELTIHAGQTQDVPAEASDMLDSNCGVGQGGGSGHLCTGWANLMPGEYQFQFPCAINEEWRVKLKTLRPQGEPKQALFTTLAVYEGDTLHGTSASTKNMVDVVEFRAQSGQCQARVDVLHHARIKLDLSPLGGVDLCHEACLADPFDAATEEGCNCEPWLVNACEGADIGDCALPANAEVPDYACPFLESEILADDDCKAWGDGGNFEHVGSCYRCGDGQQCCYEDGKDNGTGSFDICPPIDPWPFQAQEPYGCSGLGDHLRCDVVPLCACMAQQNGGIDACEACAQWVGLFDEGDQLTKETLCQDAQEAVFDWCGIVGNPNACTSRPENW